MGATGMGRNPSQPRRGEPARACDEALTALLPMEFQAYSDARYSTPSKSARPATRWARRGGCSVSHQCCWRGAIAATSASGLAVILNTNLEAMVIDDGFPHASSRGVPLL